MRDARWLGVIVLLLCGAFLGGYGCGSSSSETAPPRGKIIGATR